MIIYEFINDETQEIVEVELKNLFEEIKPPVDKNGKPLRRLYSKNIHIPANMRAVK